MPEAQAQTVTTDQTTKKSVDEVVSEGEEIREEHEQSSKHATAKPLRNLHEFWSRFHEADCDCSVFCPKSALD